MEKVITHVVSLTSGRRPRRPESEFPLLQRGGRRVIFFAFRRVERGRDVAVVSQMTFLVRLGQRVVRVDRRVLLDFDLFRFVRITTGGRGC